MREKENGTDQYCSMGTEPESVLQCELEINVLNKDLVPTIETQSPLAQLLVADPLVQNSTRGDKHELRLLHKRPCFQRSKK